MKIDEDEVDIGHEATVSKIGEEQLFYLMSRGLSESEASAMIVSRLRRADHEGAAARVRRRDEPADPAPDGGVGRLIAVERTGLRLACRSRTWNGRRRFYGETLGLPRDRAPARRAFPSIELGENVSLYLIRRRRTIGAEFTPPHSARSRCACRTSRGGAAGARGDGRRVRVARSPCDTGVCHMAFFKDPDGNAADAPPEVRAA